MAIKYFISECVSQKRHPEAKATGNVITHTIPVEAGTQAEAVVRALNILKNIDEHSDCYQKPKLGKPVSEEEYNAALIDFESKYSTQAMESEALSFNQENQIDVEDIIWPKPNNSGIYPADTDGMYRSTYSDDGNVAEILALQTSNDTFVMGYRFVTDAVSTVRPASERNGTYSSLNEAVSEARTKLINIATFQRDTEGCPFSDNVIKFDYSEDIDSQYEERYNASQNQEVKQEKTASKAFNWETVNGEISCPVARHRYDGLTVDVSIAEIKNGSDTIYRYKVKTSDNPQPTTSPWMGNAGDVPFTTLENAIGYAYGKVADELTKHDLADKIPSILNNSLQAFEDNYISDIKFVYKPLISTEKIEKALNRTFDPKNPTQALPINLINSFDKLNQYTYSQLETMAKNSEECFIEYMKNRKWFDLQKTLDNCNNVDFDSCAIIVSTFFDKNKITALIEENSEVKGGEIKVAINSILSRNDDLEYTDEQLSEMCEKLDHVANEFSEDYEIPKSAVINKLSECDFSKHRAGAVMLNIRSLRHMIRTALEEQDPPSFQDWSKTNPGKTFDDYATEFNIDPPVNKDPVGQELPTNIEVPKETTEKPVRTAPESAQKPIANKDDESPIKDDETPEATIESVVAEEIIAVKVPELTPEQLSNSNLELWNKGFKTDPEYTRLDPTTGRTSISTQYRIQKCTEMFGPVGIGWGYTVLREWIVDGSPIIRDGQFIEENGKFLREEVHKCEIEFWYKHNGEVAKLTQYGDTKKLYLTQNGYFYHDPECEKKSLSDALGKAMSMIGISADVYLGEFDNDKISQINNSAKMASKEVKAIDRAKEATEQVLESVKGFIEEMDNAANLSEINILKQKSLAMLHSLPSSTDEQKRKKSKAIKLLEDACSTHAEKINSLKNKAANEE
ncbi:hypothetical protein IHC92_20615 [Photobacterium damselae subsp. damselae]|uniref:hypothetical protein n=1 Tax=Photobacterium damselae TaxID=38293 RepID=UPI001F3D893F|nr:hypothetical protein [Photobacterium damselae]UKA23357.1 hypothetical protein IHC92_20615 [Photobacterium damselae subsp. damselae]